MPGNTVGCRNTESSKSLIDCLITKHANRCLPNTEQFFKWIIDNYTLPILVHYDGRFLKSKYGDPIGAANTVLGEISLLRLMLL